jgi:hypothetical protein
VSDYTGPQRKYVFDKSVKVIFAGSVRKSCGCLYDTFDMVTPSPVRSIRRFRVVCDTHTPMCRELEAWEIND